MIDLEKHKSTVIHCPTEESIKKVEDLIVELGGRRLWDDSSKQYLENNEQPQGMCFGLDDVKRGYNSYCHLKWYQKKEYKIITSKEFFELCGKPIDEIINNYQIY